MNATAYTAIALAFVSGFLLGYRFAVHTVVKLFSAELTRHYHALGESINPGTSKEEFKNHNGVTP